MLPTNCNQVSDLSIGASRKTGFNEDYIERELDDGSNHSCSNRGKQGRHRSSNRQQPTAAIPFPWKLHRILDDADAKGFNDVISWVPSENGFKVHKTKQFDDEIMPKYFDKTKYKSFQRQLNMWGFDRVGSGPYKGAYLHPCFIRGQPQLCESMNRTKIKGIHSKKLRKNILNSELLGGGSNHSIGGGSNHSLRGTSNHSLVGSASHSISSGVSSMDVHASIKASARKLADLERQKEEIQRKLKMVSTKANAAVASDALTNVASPRMITPQGSLHDRTHRKDRESTKDDFFTPLPLSEGDSLLFGGRNFFFVEDAKISEMSSNHLRRATRRYSLEPKGPGSEEYILKELQKGQYFGEDLGSGTNQGSNSNFSNGDLKQTLGKATVADDIISPTPLPPNLDIVKVTTNIDNYNSSLNIVFDKPKRRFSFLHTPVHNPFDKPYQIKPRPSSVSHRKINTADNNKSMMNMNINMNVMTNNMMNMNMNNQSNGNLDNLNKQRDSLHSLL